MSWEFVISWVLSHHNKNLKQGTSSWMDQYCSSVLQLSFIQKIKENPRGVRACQPKRREEKRERERVRVSEQFRETLAFWLLFLCVFPPPPGPSLCKLGQPGVLFVLPEVFTLVLGPSFVLFSRAFPFLVFQPPPFWTPFPILTT